jgi:hypothetical protein
VSGPSSGGGTQVKGEVQVMQVWLSKENPKQSVPKKEFED